MKWLDRGISTSHRNCKTPLKKGCRRTRIPEQPTAERNYPVVKKSGREIFFLEV
jgi:hypothetical protein